MNFLKITKKMAIKKIVTIKDINIVDNQISSTK